MLTDFKFGIYEKFLSKFMQTFCNYKRMGDYRRAGLDISEYLRLKQLPRHVSAETTLFGRRLKLVDGNTFLSGFREIFINEIYRFQSTNDRSLIIDCGANIGLSVAYFKRVAPESKIVAFEADPNIFSVLKFNVHSLGLQDVELHEKAVWTKDGEIDFIVEGAYSGRIPKMGDNHAIKVKSTRLKDALSASVEFLKIDIEGAEYAVLEDCKEQLSAVRNIFIEYHSHVSEEQKLHRLLEMLNAAEFRYHIHEAHTSPNPFMKRDLMLGMDLQLNIFGYR